MTKKEIEKMSVAELTDTLRLFLKLRDAGKK
jgi:hypothetical protein